MSRIKLNKTNIDALQPAEKRFTVWDTDLRGFGVTVAPSGERSYVLFYRISGRQRWLTIGRHGSPWTPEMARKEAMRLLVEVARGVDPAAKRNSDRQAISFAELCDLYLAEGVAHKKASTLRNDRSRIKLHLKPLLGTKRADAIGRADIERLLNDVKNRRTAAPRGPAQKRSPGSIATGGAGAAAQCVALASTVLQFGVDRGLRTDNPAKGVKKPPVRKLQRFLSEDEMRRLAEALDAEEREINNRFVVAAIRLLALTGCRRSEITGLRWRNVDFERRLLLLDDSKTREKAVFLSPPAVSILASLPRADGKDFVIAGREANIMQRETIMRQDGRNRALACIMVGVEGCVTTRVNGANIEYRMNEGDDEAYLRRSLAARDHEITTLKKRIAEQEVEIERLRELLAAPSLAIH